MKKLRALFLALALIATYSISAQVSINTDGSNPDSSAGLEVKFTDKGFLPPRLSTIQMLNIARPAEGLVVYNTTSKTLNVFDGTDWTDMVGNVQTPAIGDFYQGGVVFYLDGNGGGLICAVSDQSEESQWGCHGTSINGADGTDIGTGSQNTIDIQAGCSTHSIAADFCANLSLNNYSDWFLPSKNELNEMYTNKAAINTTAIANRGSAFVNSYYWSSSEYGNNFAWAQSFYYDNQNVSIKNNSSRVRAIRAF